MRLKGTGKDPRYSEGLIFDAPSAEAQDYIDKGWATEVKPEEDPGRTERQIAESVVRGDALTDPVEQKIAEQFRDENGEANRDAYLAVHDGDDPFPEAVGAGKAAKKSSGGTSGDTN